MRRRPRILVLTCHLPYPPISGGRRRELELFRRLGRDYELHLVSVSKTVEEDRANARELRDTFETISVFAADGVENGSACHVARHACDEASDHLSAVCADFDLLHVEGFYLMQHVPRDSPPVVLGEQNVEFELWRQRLGLAATELERRRLARHLQRTKAAELEAWARADLCVAVTAEDAALMKVSLPGHDVRVVPDGIDHLRRPRDPRTAPDDNEILFVANFAYAPNVDAGGFLLDEIFPRIRRFAPEARLRLVGNEPPAVERDGVEVTGRVDDIAPYLERAAVVVCPLRIGGGIKVKVLEALRLGKAIVSTRIGAQGLMQGAGDAFLQEDDPDAFAAAVAALLRDPARRHTLEERAAAFAAELPTWDEAAAELRARYERCLRTSRRALPARLALLPAE